MLEAMHTNGLDNLPAWFLKVEAPFFTTPIADMFNLLLSSSVVPKQWKAYSISPIPKIAKLLTMADHRHPCSVLSHGANRCSSITLPRQTSTYGALTKTFNNYYYYFVFMLLVKWAF